MVRHRFPSPRTLARTAGALLAAVALLGGAAPASACTHDGPERALVAAVGHGEPLTMAHSAGHGAAHVAPGYLADDACEHCDGAAHNESCEQHCPAAASLMAAAYAEWAPALGIERFSAPPAVLSGVLRSAEPPPPRA